MPLISVDELMDDPDFVSDTLKVIRTKTEVGLDGMATHSKSPALPFLGIVHPANSDELERAPEDMIQVGSIVVITAFALRSGDLRCGLEPDQVLWKHEKYIVRKIDDYTEWGAGFVSALCERQAIN